MKKILPFLIVLICILGLIGVAYFFRDRLNKKPAGIEITTSPTAAVFLNGKNVGQTPFSDKSLKAGTYSLRLVPEPVEGQDLPPWEARVDLTAMFTTVVNRTFAAAETDSFGSILHLVKEPGAKTYLSAISDPDTVSVNIDSDSKGFTPATKLEINPGSHVLSLSSPGYKSQEITINVVKGYNLVVNAKLGADQLVMSQPAPTASPSAIPVESGDPLASASPSAAPKVSPSPVTQISKPYVLVNETGTGWLRIRKEPSGAAEELGKADVGEKLKYLGESTETGWHKIEFESKAGWVSGKYVDLVK